MALTPAERSLRARLGGLAVSARYDTREVTRPARETFLARFERQVDPDCVLPAAERARCAEAAKKAYFAGLAYRRWKGNRGKSEGVS